MIIYKKYFLETAHFMPGFPKKHKYSKIHGHSYEMVIYIEGNIKKKNGWVFNFEDLDKLILPLIKCQLSCMYLYLIYFHFIH